LFPIQVYDVKSPDSAVVRTVLAIDREARSMTFAETSLKVGRRN